jgi:hypothetical protein
LKRDTPEEQAGSLAKEEIVKGRKRVVAVVISLILAGFLVLMTCFHGALADDAKSRAKPSSIRMGILKQAGSEYVIQSGRTSCRIIGKDFTPWLGKKVKVTGTMLRKDKHRVLEVAKIEEVKR